MDNTKILEEAKVLFDQLRIERPTLSEYDRLTQEFLQKLENSFSIPAKQNGESMIGRTGCGLYIR